MTAKSSVHSKINHLANLPDELTLTNIVMHENCDELFVAFKSSPNRICPSCGSNNCIIKDFGYNQTVRHTANARRGVIIDVLPQIACDYVCRYFRQYSAEQKMRVKFFCCDMHNGFVAVAKNLFPQAHICIDMFHVVNRINDTIDAIRIRLQHMMRCRILIRLKQSLCSDCRK